MSTLLRNCRAETLKDISHRLEVMGQQFLNGLTFKGSLREQYGNGEIAIVCDLDVSLPYESEDGRSKTGHNGSRFGHRDGRAILVFCSKTVDVHYLVAWNQELVFVRDVKVVQNPESFIPSFVRLYAIQNEVDDRLEGLGYFSTMNGRRDLSLCGSNRKFDVRVGGGKHTDKLVPDVVEGTAHIVNCIADDRCESWREMLIRRREVQDIASLVRVEFDGDAVSVFVDKPLNFRVKLIDMLFGSINL